MIRTRLDIRLPRSVTQRAAPSDTRITHIFSVDASLPISSSAIARIEYDPDIERLIIILARDGYQATYYGVPEIEVHRLISATSPGKYHNSYIRGKY